MEYFLYEANEIRIVISTIETDLVCTTNNGETSFRQRITFLPMNFQKAIGSLNQYVLKTLAMITISPNELISKHLLQLTKMLKLTTHLPYEKFAVELKKAFILVLQDGIKVWLFAIRHFVSSEEKDLSEISGNFSRYLMTYHVFLYEYLNQISANEIVSPLWIK